MNHLKLHNQIEKFFEDGPKGKNTSADFVRDELHIEDNHDARNYFFHIASQYDKEWFDWIANKKLFTELKKSEDQIKEEQSKDKRRVHASELDYLANMTEKYPEGVARVIDAPDNATTDENFNPAIVGRFLWIISKLPAKQITKLTGKMIRENWIKNRIKYNSSGYEFAEIVEKLADANEYESLLELAQLLMSVKSLDSREKKDIAGHTMYSDSIFYLSDITQSKIFDTLLNVEDKENVLQILKKVLENLIVNSGAIHESYFSHNDPASFYDENLFNIELNEGRSYGHNADIKNLVIVIVKIGTDIVRNNSNKAHEQRKILELLPNPRLSRLVWRLHLRLLSECPEIFQEELESMFFAVFNVNNEQEIIGGPEYAEALRRSFKAIKKKDLYIQNVLNFFTKKDKEHPDQKWHKRDGWQILSSISQEFLTEEHKMECEKRFGSRTDNTYRPEPDIQYGRTGIIQSRSPIDISSIEISKVFKNIKTEWIPENLSNKHKDDDFLRPRGVEGLGDALKDDIIKRTNEYLEALINEEELEKFAPHYVYSMIRGLEDMSRDKHRWEENQIDQLLAVFTKIGNLSVDQKLFKERKDQEDSWLANWTVVHKPIVDVLLHIVSQENIKKYISVEERRSKIYVLLEYVLSIKGSPSPENEDPKYGDLYHIAINSVRGRAFEVFTIFIEKEGDKLSEGAKKLYKKVLKYDSLAVRFIVGRYLASFYFRDKNFIKEKLSHIFPKNSNNELFLAAWGGYLSNSLYKELYQDMATYYTFAINMKNINDQYRCVHDHSIDSLLAVHMALAYVYLGDNHEDGSVVSKFWKTNNQDAHKEFISYIGQRIINNPKVLKSDEIDAKRIVDFWNWALKKKRLSPETYAAFLHWVTPKDSFIETTVLIDLVLDTLKKSHGLCLWEFGLMERIPQWADEYPYKVFDIIKYYLEPLSSQRDFASHGISLHKSVIKNCLASIYSGGDRKIRNKIKRLINKLIGARSQDFWDFKTILEA